MRSLIWTTEGSFQQRFFSSCLVFTQLHAALIESSGELLLYFLSAVNDETLMLFLNFSPRLSLSFLFWPFFSLPPHNFFFLRYSSHSWCPFCLFVFHPPNVHSFWLLSLLCCRPVWLSGFRSAFSQCHQDRLGSDWRYWTVSPSFTALKTVPSYFYYVWYFLTFRVRDYAQYFIDEKDILRKSSKGVPSKVFGQISSPLLQTHWLKVKIYRHKRIKKRVSQKSYCVSIKSLNS